MIQGLAKRPLLIGIVMLLAATGLGAAGDGFAKYLSMRLPAPEILMMANGFVALITFVVTGALGAVTKTNANCLTTKRPDLLLMRCLATAVSAFAFFFAIKLLPLTDVFLFIGLTPIMAAASSKLVLKEAIGRAEWVGLLLGGLGISLLFTGELNLPGLGHWAGFIGAFAGTISLMLSRRMAQFETNAMVQVFYPNLCVAVVAAGWAVFSFHPITLPDLQVGVIYGLCMFLGRWSLVLMMRYLRPTVAFPLTNIQFVWMAAIGYLQFGEVPTAQTVLGACLVALAGGIALLFQTRLDRVAAPMSRGLMKA